MVHKHYDWPVLLKLATLRYPVLCCTNWATVLSLKAGVLYPLTGEWLQYETISRWSLTTVWLNWTNGLIRLINSMVTELIRPMKKVVKLKESYSALYTPLLPLNFFVKLYFSEPKNDLLTLLASCDFRRLLIIFANILGPDRAWQSVGPDLDPKGLALWYLICSQKYFFKNWILKKVSRR